MVGCSKKRVRATLTLPKNVRTNPPNSPPSPPSEDTLFNWWLVPQARTLYSTGGYGWWLVRWLGPHYFCSAPTQVIASKMNQFISRIVNYVANEVLIKGLANSKTFQRFALKTDHHVQQYKKQGQSHIDETLDELHKTATETMYKGQGEAQASGYRSAVGGGGGGLRAKPTPPLRGFPGFISAFGKEVKKDLGFGR